MQLIKFLSILYQLITFYRGMRAIKNDLKDTFSYRNHNMLKLDLKYML